MQITVLGAGLIGSAIVQDLARDARFKVTVVDRRQVALDKLEAAIPVQGIPADLLAVGDLIPVLAACDLVICAVPGFMGFETVRRVIEAGKDVVDISFFSEDPFELDELAKAKGVTAVVDCGVAPGLCNMIGGHVVDLLDQTDRYICYVGGLPVIRRWPFQYKAVFSPADVLEEYLRPARFVENGREVVRPALSEVELLDFEDLGTLEAFNTDGLRTLRQTLTVSHMKEKTLRYPGHADLMRVFRESGFFSTTPIEINGLSVAPMAVTSKLLFDQWQLQEGEEDITLMRVLIEGQKGKQKYRYTYDLRDAYDRQTRTTSMARTTAYTCTMVARLVIEGLFQQKGICPPEYIGRDQRCYENLLAGLQGRNIRLKETVSEL
ncbi:MAG: saccharopine dehydrogenase NADP-binding domain-containing protein [Desulfobacterales bacterium]|nr:MAG: saccharopine dehydrogenase NADP-binding domain-containing protein [Desulfobacterales bacterium]